MSVTNSIVKCGECGNEGVVRSVYHLSKHTDAIIRKKCSICGL